MRTVVAAAIVVLLTSAAYCQSAKNSGGRPGLNFPLGDSPSTPDPQSEEHEKAYKSAIEKIPPRQQKTEDPWQGVRSNSTTQTQKTGR
jgi:hypothetical protein